MMPFRPDFYEALTGLETHARYFAIFRSQVPKILHEYGYQCHDFSSPATLRLTSDDFRDKMHVHHYVYRELLKGVNLALAANRP